MLKELKSLKEKNKNSSIAQKKFKYSQVMVDLSNEEFYLNNKTVFLKNEPAIPKGNYYLTVKSSCSISKNQYDEFFFRNFGDGKIKEVHKIEEEWSYSQEESQSSISHNDVGIEEDTSTNWLIIKLISENVNLQVNDNYYSLVKSYIPNLSRRKYRDYIGRLYDRVISKPSLFSHLSCKTIQEKNLDNIIGTYKSIYCQRCFIYDCKQHFIKEESLQFDSYQSYDMDEYLKSVEILTHNKLNSNDYWFNVKLNLTKYKKENFIKISNSSNQIKNSSNQIKNSTHYCSSSCYKKNLNETDRYSLPNTIENEICLIYLDKLIKIFFWDVCSITKILNLISGRNNFSCRDIAFNVIKKGSITNEMVKSIHKDKSSKVKSKKNLQMKLDETLEYHPCYHKGNEKCDENCECSKRGYCEKHCVCNPNLCNYKFNYCSCKGSCSTEQCPCFYNNRECDPDNCKHCDKSNSKCKNNACRKKIIKRTAIGKSEIAGWGLFALEDIKKDEYINEYVGEIIEESAVSKREQWNILENLTYFFALHENYTIDSKFIGNKLRFSNHSKNKNKMNLYSKLIFSEGCQKICLYALRDIKKYEELVFDYDGKNELAIKYKWINADCVPLEQNLLTNLNSPDSKRKINSPNKSKIEFSDKKSFIYECEHDDKSNNDDESYKFTNSPTSQSSEIDN